MYSSILPKRALAAYRCSPWKDRLDARATTLLDRGYSTGTLRIRLPKWVDFAGQFETSDLPSDLESAEVRAYIETRSCGSRNVHSAVRTALRLFLEPEDKVSLRLRPPPGPSTALYDEHVPPYLVFARQHRGRCPSRGEEGVLRAFFAKLERGGIEVIGELGLVEIRDYLAGQGHLARSSVAWQASILRSFFRFLAMRGLVRTDLARLIESPKRYRLSKPPEVLDEETVERLLAVIDRSTPIGKRDYAMLLLAARYGMRPSDIRGLCLDDIYWREGRIGMVQTKTQRPLELPLLDDVDDALVDYLRHGRPECSARQVFVRHRAPIRPLVTCSSLWFALQTAFETVGATPASGPKGLSLMRHSVASRMLAQGVPMDTISDVLGHASIEATRIYAHVDIQGLRSVALSAAEVCP
jgi:site-specific recombinase XerD